MSDRPANRFELFTCGWKGHALVGTDAARVTDADAAVVRQVGEVRWYHCLRCYDWVAEGLPSAPSRDTVPARTEIELPLRGRLLRDRYILRLISCDRAVHVTVLAVLAVIIFFVAGDHATLQHDYTQIVNAFGGPSQAHPFLGHFKHLFTITSTHLYEAGAVVVAYGVLEATEMVGLWFARRWAEYLTFVATVVLIRAHVVGEHPQADHLRPQRDHRRLPVVVEATLRPERWSTGGTAASAGRRELGIVGGKSSGPPDRVNDGA